MVYRDERIHMRKIHLEGADNVRELGGIQNREGRYIKNNVFIRSNALARLTKADEKALGEHKLRQVIDLRTHVEANEEPNVRIDGVLYHHIPLIDERAVGITHDKASEHQEDPDQVLYMPDMYKHIVTDHDAVKQLAKVFDIILHAEDGATLWHCAAGKDRCGIVSALVLFILEVDPKTIMEDYLQTNDAAFQWADNYYRAILEKTGNQLLAERYKDTFIADANYLLAAEQAIVAKWGSIDDFIHNQLGITEDEIKRFKERVLEVSEN